MAAVNARLNRPGRIRMAFKRCWILYLMILPVVAYYVIFHYLPMGGLVIAFKDYRVARGILGSKWVGLKHFIDFFQSEYAWQTTRNTLSISCLGLIFSFPAPIILAILLNEVKAAHFKKAVQTITYMPHFISLVIICAMVRDFCATRGLFNTILNALGFKSIDFLIQPKWFYPIYITSGIWQNIGWNSIIYLSALSAIDQELYEAAAVDGAGRLRRIWSVTLPGILPTITILLILRIGSIMSVGFEKIILLYNPSVYETADVISTYVYRRGLVDGKYSFASAVGLMNSIINFALLLMADRLSKHFGQSGLF